GQPQKTLEAAREAVHLGPDNAVPYANLIRAYQRTGRFGEAKSLYDEVVARKLDGIVAHLIRTMIAGVEDDQAEVQRQLEWSRGKAQEGDILNQLALVALGRGQFRHAQKLLNEVEKVSARNGLHYFALSCLREYSESTSEVGLSDSARAYAN